MTLLDYIRLDAEEKSNALWKQGTLLDVYTDKDHVVTLFYLFNFFVEVTVNYKDGKIVDLIPYKSGFSFSAVEQKKNENLKEKAGLINYYFIL